MKTAVIAGASGLVGSYLLDRLLSHSIYDQVTVIVRRPLNKEHPRLHQVVHTLADPATLTGQLQGDDFFCCLGTTLRKAGSRASFRKVDRDLPLALAKVAMANGFRHFLVISAMGANPRSMIFYNRAKGKLERDLRKLGLPRLTIVRPSLLLGERKEKRLGEDLGKLASRFLNPLLPKKYRAIHAEDLAAAMQAIAEHPVKAGTFESNELLDLAASALRRPARSDDPLCP